MAAITTVHSNVAAFLDMIAFSEGTDNGRQATRDRGYDVVVGGNLFHGYDDHPRELVQMKDRRGNPIMQPNGKPLSSTAAGRYQLLSRYFDPYKKQLGLKDFSPLSQDLIALQQIREQKALRLVEAGRFCDAIALVKNIWASLPGAGYGQHENKLADLAAVYRRKGGVLT